MSTILSSAIFHILLTVGLYSVFTFVYKKTKFALLNPLLLTAICIILYLTFTNGVVSEYSNNLNIVSTFLSPLTVCLAIPVFSRIHIIKRYYIHILIGTVVGVSVSMGSIYLLGNLFGLDDQIIISMLPKSVTTPIAIEVSGRLGGIQAITVFVVVLTGVLGALFGPLLLKLYRIKRSPAVGMPLGGTSHAIGTSKAVEISARAGAISSVAIVTSGILTAIVSLFI